MTRLLRSELLKIRTTNTWWLLGLGSVLTTGLALLINCERAAFYLHETFTVPQGASPAEVEQARQAFAAQHQVLTQATNIFTSGQLFGCLFVALLGVLLITNEYYHQMATTTYLATPHRTKVVVA